MKTTQKQINDAIKELADLTGKANNKDSAIKMGLGHYLTYDLNTQYGGYQLVMINVEHCGHSGAFDYSAQERRVKADLFYDKLNALIIGVKYGLKNSPVIRTIDVIAKEWFDKVNGNCYVSAQITLNYGLPNERTIKMPYEYGYSEAYLQYAFKTLHNQKVIDDYEETRDTFQRYCQRKNIILRKVKIENCKKAIVKAWGE